MIIINVIYLYGAKYAINPANEPLVVLNCTQNFCMFTEILFPTNPNIAILQRFSKKYINIKEEKKNLISALDVSYNNI